MRTRVNFDGTELTDLAVVSNLRRPLLPRTVSTEDVAGVDGARFSGGPLDPATISLTLAVVGKDPSERERRARALAGILNVHDPAPLSISIDGGLWYMAVPSSVQAGERFLNADSFEVEFLAPDPVRYGAKRKVTLPSGGSATFLVGGNYPTMPTITAPSAKNGSGGVWQVRMDGGDYVQASVQTAQEVVVDCAQRVLRVSGAVKMMATAADWLVMEPGRHTLQMVGTGAATVEWVERWL